MSLVSSASKIISLEKIPDNDLEYDCSEAFTIVDEGGNGKEANVSFNQAGYSFGGSFSLSDCKFVEYGCKDRYYGIIDDMTNPIVSLLKSLQKLQVGICEIVILPLADGMFSGNYNSNCMYMGLKKGASSINEGGVNDKNSFGLVIFI